MPPGKIWNFYRPLSVLLLGSFVWLGPGCATLAPRPPDNSRAGRVIELAKSLQGRPYRYGGSTPRGFDCSGFVGYVFQHAADVRLPRSSREQYAFGRQVPQGLEEPSDLIFFDVSGQGVSHVGIYLGKGRFIHAPQNGGRVKISDANDDYWQKRFRGLRRLI